MKLGILSQWYDPEPGPASLPAVYAREFIARGHEVRVLTGFPNYPDGKLHDGYRIRGRSHESRDGAELTRVALYPNHSSSALGRVANYASFALSSTALGGAALRGLDAVWAYNSPVTVSLPLLTHTRWGRTPYFLHVQDLWPDSLTESGMIPAGGAARVASRLIDRIVRLTEHRAAVIGVISPSVREIILERHPDLDPNKIVYAPNPTNEAVFRPVAETRELLGIPTHTDGPVEVMYLGAVGQVQGLDVVLDAARELRGTNARISIVGDGISRDRLRSRALREGLTNVRFVDRVPQYEVPELIARSQVQLVTLAAAPFLRHTTPSKIASLLASGVPIVGQLDGDGARLIRDAEAGVAVTPGDVKGLAKAIAGVVSGGPRLWADMGERGRTYYDLNLSVKRTSSAILRAMAAATACGNPGPEPL